MQNTNRIPARNLQKSYKAIIEEVKTKKQMTILTTNDKPQAAIISLEDLEKLKKAKAKQANIEMLKLGLQSQKEIKNLPANLREQANEILYGKHE